MKNEIQTISRYISYWFKSKTKYDIHSPFVFELLTQVILDKKLQPDYKLIETERKLLLKNKQVIEVSDFGAGSKYGTTSNKPIAHIAKHALKPPKYAQLIYRLAKHLNPNNVLELGTSLGITTTYLAKACPRSKIVTLEGCPNTAKVATDVFEKLGLKNIHQEIGKFDDLLDTILTQVTSLDLVFIDGNHRELPTLNYFNKCLPKAHEETLIIVDDINWSEEMQSAWNKLSNHPSVTISVDLFFLGLLFFRKGKEKEHFVLKF